MSRFYIERLLIQGPNHPDAVVEFQDGVNFVLGPSNTGKSLIMDAIDYVFGLSPSKKRPFRFDPSFGYTDFTLQIKTKKGTVALKRSTQRLKTKVFVTSTDPDIGSGTYCISNGTPLLNEVFLKLLGIDKVHEVWSSADGRKNQFTWRNILHMFFIKQSLVSRETSVILNPLAGFGTNDTSMMYSLLFLLHGEDADEGDNPDTKEKKKTKREAVMDYIRQNINRLQKRMEEVKEKLQIGSVPEINSSIQAINSEMDDVGQKISAAMQKSGELVREIYAGNTKLSEYTVIQNQFSELREQYLSDIERLTFVVDGERLRARQQPKQKCPFCDGDIQVNHSPKYYMAVRADMNHIQTHLSNLELAAEDLQKKATDLREQIQRLEDEKAEIDKALIIDLRPRFNQLKARIDGYKEYIRLTREIELIEEEEHRYSGELLAKEVNGDPVSKDHIYKNDFDIKDIQDFESILIDILHQSGFSGYSAARFNMDTVDLEIAGRQKSSTNGGGYCGILNTIVALAMMEYLLQSGVYPPGLLIVDSSLSQLSESESKERGETIKARFINYVIRHPRDGQVIIIEHKEKVPVDEIKTSTARVIEFSGVEGSTIRYGLLPGITNNVK